MISTRSVGLVIDTVVCLTLAKWETASGQFGGYRIASQLDKAAVGKLDTVEVEVALRLVLMLEGVKCRPG